MTLDEAMAKAHVKAREIFETTVERFRDDLVAHGLDDDTVEAMVAYARKQGEESITEQMAGIRRQLCEPEAPTGRLQ